MSSRSCGRMVLLMLGISLVKSEASFRLFHVFCDLVGATIATTVRAFGGFGGAFGGFGGAFGGFGGAFGLLRSGFVLLFFLLSLRCREGGASGDGVASDDEASSGDGVSSDGVGDEAGGGVAGGRAGFLLPGLRDESSPPDNRSHSSTNLCFRVPDLDLTVAPSIPPTISAIKNATKPTTFPLSFAIV
eukprot:Hpha_TRINITY_DN12448_c0_g2::TRINITY_DN12448_c0_g2_i1::g.42907::m.42907